MPALLSTKVLGLAKLRKRLRGASVAVIALLQGGQIENFILARTKARFAPKGSNPVAQKDPEGKPWPGSDTDTIKRRDNKRGNQALYNSGTLYKSIKISKRNTFAAALQSVTGGSVIVGVAKNSPAYRYARLMQGGGKTPRGGVVPARPFIGLGREDVKIISNFVETTLRSTI